MTLPAGLTLGAVRLHMVFGDAEDHPYDRQRTIPQDRPTPHDPIEALAIIHQLPPDYLREAHL